MKSLFTENQKIDVVHDFLKGDSVKHLAEKYMPVENANDQIKINYSKMKRTIERQYQMIEILKAADCTVHSELKVKMNEMEKLIGKYSIHLLCETLEVDRGTFYNHIKRNKRNNTKYQIRREHLRNKIQSIFEENNQIFGAKKITAVLQESGETVSTRMVSDLMHEMNLVSIRTNSKSEYIKDKHKQNKLKQQFSVQKPNTVWTSDVTYFKYNEKWYYICVVIDLFSRKILSYGISRSNSTQLTKST